VTAIDNGSPQLSAATRVVLTVLSLPRPSSSNRAPTITTVNRRTVRVNDTQHAGYTLTQVEGADADGDAVWWSLVGTDADIGLFDLRRDTGELTLCRQLRADDAHEHALTYAATDGVSVSDESQLIVHVQATRIRRPMFSMSEYAVNVSETIAVVGDTVAQVGHIWRQQN
jgi:hypothetical protein